MPRPKVCSSLAEAVEGFADGATVIVPGFGGTGTPWNLLTALYAQGATGLTLVLNSIQSVTNDTRVKGVSDLVDAGRVKKVIASFTAATHPTRISRGEQLVREGKMEAELVPQGTLAERIRAGGAGIPAFYTPAGVGTLLSTGKEHRTFEGETYVLEEGIFADYALVRAWKADTAGNLVFRHAGRNYNPIAAMAARHTIVEVEEPIVEAGALDPDEVHTPGIYVERLVPIQPHGVLRVERGTLPTAAPAAATHEAAPATTPGKRRLTRTEIAAVIAQRMQPGWVANLGIGIPTQASDFVDFSAGITLTSENGVIGYSRLAAPGKGDPDIVNAGGQQVEIVPGAAFVHHADSFGLIRSRRVDVTVLGAYEAAQDGSFANWRLSDTAWDHLGGIGGAMDLVARAKQIWLAMEHTTRDGKPRLLERCTLPVTSPRGVTLIVTDLAVISVRGGRFLLEEHAPGYTAAEIAAVTGARLEVSPALREVSVRV